MLLYMSQWNTSNINEFPNDNIMFKLCSDVWYQRCQKELIPVLYWGVIPRQSSKWGNWGGGIKGDMGRVILIEITVHLRVPRASQLFKISCFPLFGNI